MTKALKPNELRDLGIVLPSSPPRMRYVVVGSFGEGSCYYHTIVRALYHHEVPVDPVSDKAFLAAATEKKKSTASKAGVRTVPLHRWLGLKGKAFAKLSPRQQRAAGLRLRERLGSESDFCAHFDAMLRDIGQEERTHTLAQTAKTQCPTVQKNMRRSSEWGDTFAISYAGWRLKFNQLFVYDRKRPYCGITRTVYPATVIVHWHAYAHFEGVAVRLDTGDADTGVRLRFVFAPTDPLVRYLMGVYASCSINHEGLMKNIMVSK